MPYYKILKKNHTFPLDKSFNSPEDFSFTNEENVAKFIRGGELIARVSAGNVRKIIGDRFVSETITLCDVVLISKSELWDDEQFCENAVRKFPYAMQFVKNQTEKICKIAIENCWWAMQFVRKQTSMINRFAVTVNPWNLKFVKEQTEDLCIIAVQKDWNTLSLVQNQTNRICDIAYEKGGIYSLWLVRNKYQYLAWRGLNDKCV